MLLSEEMDNLCYRNVYFLAELFFYIELAITEIKRQLFALLYFFFEKVQKGKKQKNSVDQPKLLGSMTTTVFRNTQNAQNECK